MSAGVSTKNTRFSPHDCSPHLIHPPQSASDVYALMETAGPAAASVLLDALERGAWRVQLAAADVAGQLELRAAVPTLLRLFEKGEKELPYPELKYWWRWSRATCAKVLTACMHW